MTESYRVEAEVLPDLKLLRTGEDECVGWSSSWKSSLRDSDKEDFEDKATLERVPWDIEILYDCIDFSIIKLDLMKWK